MKTTRSFWQKIKEFCFKGFSRNISDKQLKAILDNTVDAIITINEQGIIQSFNKGAEKMFGFSREETLGKNVNMLMPEPFHNQHDTYLANYLKTREKKIIGIGREVLAKRKDGLVFSIDLAVSEVLVGNKHLFTGIIRNITDQKGAEAVKQQNIRMEAEVNAKNEYISILSHELRTPLTVVHGILGLILSDTALSEKARELLLLAYRNSERLTKIISDVLDIGKIQSGKLKIECKPISIITLIQESIKSSQMLAIRKDIIFIEKIPTTELMVFADYNRLIQVMLNLLSNAIKFSPIGGKVTISLDAIDKKVRVSVQDEGSGISEEFQLKIFTPFSQANHADTRLEGIGLGLHICKSIIDQLGGAMGFITRKDVGTTFYFELPLYNG